MKQDIKYSYLYRKFVHIPFSTSVVDVHSSNESTILDLVHCTVAE